MTDEAQDLLDEMAKNAKGGGHSRVTPQNSNNGRGNTGYPQDYRSAELSTSAAIGANQADYNARTYFVTDPFSDSSNPTLLKRVVDATNTSTGVIAESKFGAAYLTYFIEMEVAKDVSLLWSGEVDAVEWHFYYSWRSNSIGPSGPLRSLLEFEGIRVVMHPVN